MKISKKNALTIIAYLGYMAAMTLVFLAVFSKSKTEATGILILFLGIIITSVMLGFFLSYIRRKFGNNDVTKTTEAIAS